MRGVTSAAFVLAAFFATGPARAQSTPAAPETIAVGDWQLSPLLELRTRGEYRRDAPELAGTDAPNGTFPRVRNAYGVLERTRLGVGADYGTARGESTVLRAQVTLQDARAWGAPSPTGVLGGVGSGPASFGAYEAWIEARTSAARPAFVRLGRQAVTWGDGRLVSNADGSPVARALDAVRGHASFGLFDAELFAALLDAPRPLGAAFGDTTSPVSTGTQLYAGQLAVAIAPLLRGELSLFARVSRSTPADNSRFALARAEGETYVGSLRVFGEARGWRYAVEGAYELGRAHLLSDANLSAWAAAGYVEKKLDGLVLAPTVRVALEGASGDDGGGTYRQFDPLLPDVHPLHGAMDVFAWSNTVQGSARVSVAPWAEGRLAVEYRYARLVEADGEWLDSYLGSIGRARGGQELGHEVDISLGCRPWPVLEVGGGYSLLALGDAARAILTATESAASGTGVQAGSPAHFAYLQATLRVP